MHFAVVHAGQRVLGDEQRVPIETVAEVGECLVGLLAQIDDQLGVEHGRLGGSPQERERALLGRIQLGRIQLCRFVHEVDTNEGVSQTGCNTPARH